MSIDWKKKYEELAAQREDELMLIRQRQKTEHREFLIYFNDGTEIHREGDLDPFLDSLSESQKNQIFSISTRRASEWEPIEIDGDLAIA
ncbi:gp84 [Corynebacterium phage P1201]|uniref:Gp84 n=1 Tax=Corynebacterium phage P1201 TaxID=384848 RepID=A7IYF1_9CAUD|nr:gp84 [Corynebacterium phage P1201]ABF57534.1 gp84 [Corynebacterium phage P1201]